MINIDHLEQRVDAVHGDHAAASKAQWAEIVADLRKGAAARAELARGRAFDRVIDVIAGVPVYDRAEGFGGHVVPA